MASEKKMKSQEISNRIAKHKKEYKKFKEQDDARKVKDSDYAKKSMMMDLYLQDRSPEKFPGFDQANRIRGGLKKGGSVKKKKSSGKAIRGKGCEIR